MGKSACAWVLIGVAALGCGASESEDDTTLGDAPGRVTGVRGDRYCELLIGTLDGSRVHIDVYNTYQQNDCPADAWASVDPAVIKDDTRADVIIQNGPRYWLMDAFENTRLIDPTVKTFGALEMRLSGTLDVSLAEVMGGEAPYEPRDVSRTTTWVYDAGARVYELVDVEGQIFDMQSYSVQKTTQTEASLSELGATLTLPSGWAFRSRVLDSELRVTAVDGVATVVRDGLENTYQLSQQ
jgi:hypothetical protein